MFLNFSFIYIDPGTGSMLFTILIGVLSAAAYFLRNSLMKLRFIFSLGKQQKVESDTIPFVIFTDSKRYWNMFQPICDEFEKRKQQVVYMTASPDDPALNEKYEHVSAEFIGSGNIAFARMNMLKADVVLSTTPGVDVYQWKRSTNVKWYAHILHAANDVIAYRMFGIDYYDAVMVSGEYQKKQVRLMEEMRHLPAKELPLIGLPHMDMLRKRLLESKDSADHPVTVLLAPSWGASSILNRFGEKMIDALLKTGYHIIIRPHPQSYESEKAMLDGLMDKYPAGDKLEWDSSNDNFEVLQRSDILISDYSGVIFDFSLVFDKPVIYADTSFDKGPYDAWWLEDEMWTFSTLPKIGRQLTQDNFEKIGELIASSLSDSELAKARDNAREETWANIGRAAEFAVDYLIEKRQSLLEEQDAEKESA
ncbi:MAG: CDP-glycerol glycerophosphotransferase family protein [Clostridia bacterium]|nr:CDP-glycerol glycerophosphotransferase family protein [Clostridia bacterium]